MFEQRLARATLGVVFLQTTLVCAFVLSADPKEPTSKDASLRYKLQTVDAPEGLLPGWDVEGPITGDCWRWTVGRKAFFLIDLDGDGALSPGQDDGLAMKGAPFVVKLPSVIVLPFGECTIRIDADNGLAVKLERETFGLSRPVLTGAAELTFARLKSGLPPVRIDPESCRHCVAHCEYLKKNDLEDGRSGLSVHAEDPARPGYTDAGYAAARRANFHIPSRSVRSSIWLWYATTWHAAPMLDPNLESIGIAYRHRVAMMSMQMRFRARLERPYIHPPNGATEIPRKFCLHGERPNPIPGADGRGCGFPVFIRLTSRMIRTPLTRATLKTKDGQLLPGTFCCPSNPATPDWPTNSGIAAFIPDRPLPPRATLTAEFQFEGREAPIRWEFTTGAR